jgi:transketolase C-terminal domain/subunit
MRAAFVRGLTAAARRDPRIMLLTSDLGYKIFDAFAGEFPADFSTSGVAEANMIGVAAGWRWAACGHLLILLPRSPRFAVSSKSATTCAITIFR